MNLLTKSSLKMRPLSRREKFLVVLLLLLVIISLYTKFVFEPQLDAVNHLKTELKNQQGVLATRLEQGWDDVPLLKARTNEIEKEIEQIYLRVPNIVDEPKLLVDFYQLARMNGIEADKIKFDKLQPVKGYNYSFIRIHLDVSGLNSDIYNFIAALEQYPRMNKIYEVTFKPLDNSSGNCSLAVEFYVLGQIKPDPMDYSFMEGQYGKDRAHQIFGPYIEETEEDTNGIETKAEETKTKAETAVDSPPEDGDTISNDSQNNKALKWLLPVPQWIRTDE